MWTPVLVRARRTLKTTATSATTRIGVGIPKTLPRPRNANIGSRTVTDAAPVRIIGMLPAMPNIENVAMNGGAGGSARRRR